LDDIPQLEDMHSAGRTQLVLRASLRLPSREPDWV